MGIGELGYVGGYDKGYECMRVLLVVGKWLGLEHEGVRVGTWE